MGRAIGLLLIVLGLTGIGLAQIDWSAADKDAASRQAEEATAVAAAAKQSEPDAADAAEPEIENASAQAENNPTGEADLQEVAVEPSEQVATATITESEAGDIKVFDYAEPSSDETLPWVDIAAGSEAFSEDSDHASFILTLSEPVERPIIIIFSTVDGSARSDEDYLSQRGTVTFEPGMVSAEIRTPLVDDQEAEGDEQFAMVLNGAPSIVKLRSQRIRAIIKDND